MLNLIKGSEIPPFESFATLKSMNLLKYLKINRDFLNEDPEDWKDNYSSFEEGMKKVSNLPVINDVAERGVKLIGYFNGRHTTKHLRATIISFGCCFTRP